MIILTNKQLEQIKNLSYPEANFDKFRDPRHPEYEEYFDRIEERRLDEGFNLGVEYALGIVNKGILVTDKELLRKLVELTSEHANTH